MISGEEEAQLAFRSAARHFDLEGRSTAVVDIGGGSVEVILSAGTAIDQVYSLPAGRGQGHRAPRPVGSAAKQALEGDEGGDRPRVSARPSVSRPTGPRS